jgi:hypothetical protein
MRGGGFLSSRLGSRSEPGRLGLRGVDLVQERAVEVNERGRRILWRERNRDP